MTGTPRPNEMPDVGPAQMHQSTPSSLGSRAMAGGAWASAVSVFGKLTAAISFVVMARILSEEQYAMAAFALSASAWLVIASPLAMSDVLISHHTQLHQITPIAQRYFRLSVIFSSVFLLSATAVIAVIRPQFERVTFVALVALVGLRPLLESLLAVPVSIARIELRYRLISLVDGAANLTATVLGIFAALLGAGPFALVLPSVLSVTIRAVVLRSYVSPALPSAAIYGSSRIEAPLRRAFFRVNMAQYVHNAAFAVDMVALGWLALPKELGLFSFAFLLASQSNAVIGFQLGSVLQPIFVRLRGDRARETQAFHRVLRYVGAVMVPISVVQAAVGGSLFKLLFPDRWEAAVPAFVALSLAQGFYFAVHPTMAFLKSRRRFNLLLRWQLAHVAVSIVVLLPCAAYGNAGVVAAASSGLWACSVMTAVFLATDRGYGSRTALLVDFARPWIVAVPVGIAIHFASAPIAEWNPWIGLPSLLALGATGVLVSLMSNIWINRDLWKEINALLSQSIRRISTARKVPR